MADFDRRRECYSEENRVRLNAPTGSGGVAFNDLMRRSVVLPPAWATRGVSANTAMDVILDCGLDL